MSPYVLFGTMIGRLVKHRERREITIIGGASHKANFMAVLYEILNNIVVILEFWDYGYIKICREYRRDYPVEMVGMPISLLI